LRLHPHQQAQWYALHRYDKRIARRAWEHRSNAVGGFVRDYGVHRLVFVEFHETMTDAILREKRIKKWRRAWKLELIERDNPQWRDLWDELA
jgi:putative endonuclease